MDILTWSYCHSVDVIALYSGDGDYAEAARRARALGLASKSMPSRPATTFYRAIEIRICLRNFQP